MVKGIPDIDLDTCTGCGTCVEWCPSGAVGMVDGKAVIIKPQDCYYCADCEAVCSYKAIKCPFDIILVANPPSKDVLKQK